MDYSSSSSIIFTEWENSSPPPLSRHHSKRSNSFLAPEWNGPLVINDLGVLTGADDCQPLEVENIFDYGDPWDTVGVILGFPSTGRIPPENNIIANLDDETSQEHGTGYRGHWAADECCDRPGDELVAGDLVTPNALDELAYDVPGQTEEYQMLQDNEATSRSPLWVNISPSRQVVNQTIESAERYSPPLEVLLDQSNERELRAVPMKAVERQEIGVARPCDEHSTNEVRTAEQLIINGSPRDSHLGPQGAPPRNADIGAPSTLAISETVSDIVKGPSLFNDSEGDSDEE